MRQFLKSLGSRGSKKIRFVDVNPPVVRSAHVPLAIVCIVKNAERHLEEWLRFHLEAGVAHVFAYENDSADATRDILTAFPRDQVTIIPWSMAVTDNGTGRYLSAQVAAYAHAITTFGGRAERLAFIDIDEFLVPDGAESIPVALDKIGSFSNISLPWLMYGHCGHKTPPDGGVLANYTRRAVTPYARGSSLLRFKCIVRPEYVKTVGVHSFQTTDMGDATANTRGQVMPHSARKSSEFFAMETLRLHHYYALSEAETAEKIARGPIANATRDNYRNRVREKIAEIEAATVEDDTALTFRAALSRR